MVSVWHEQCGEIGVPVLYKYDRKLVGECKTKSRLSRVWICESQFADDLALYAVNRVMLKSAGRKFVQVGSQFGLTISIPKTKSLAIEAVSDGDFSAVEVGSRTIEMIEGVTYLGSDLSVIEKGSSVGLPKHVKLSAPCGYQIVIFL